MDELRIQPSLKNSAWPKIAQINLIRRKLTLVDKFGGTWNYFHEVLTRSATKRMAKNGSNPI